MCSVESNGQTMLSLGDMKDISRAKLCPVERCCCVVGKYFIESSLLCYFVCNFCQLNVTEFISNILFYFDHVSPGGPGSSVGTATSYGLDDRSSNSVGGEIFRTCPDRP